MYQETKETPVTGLAEPRFKRLADAIRCGIKKRPKQAFRVLLRGRDEACAVGTALEGGMSQDDRIWCQPVPYPVRDQLRPSTEAGVATVMEYLNDKRLWTRERIADWLMTL